MQIELTITILKLARQVDLFIFFMEDNPGAPLLAVKSLRKDNLWMLPSATNRTIRDLSSKLQVSLQFFSFLLSNNIVVYSDNLIKKWGIERFRTKTLVAYEHFVDSSYFKAKTGFSDRGPIIGYIGRLSTEKGVMSFVDAIPEILQSLPNARFLIVGDGLLRSSIESKVKKNAITDKVTIVGWVPHHLLSNYLNKLSLLIIPSSTEGLPNILLESMASGTPVIATKVGMIPEIIKDGFTGFLIESNQPHYIAQAAIKLLGEPKLLEGVSKKSVEWVQSNFSHEAAEDHWRKILSNFC